VREAGQKAGRGAILLAQDVEPLVEHSALVWDTLTGSDLKSTGEPARPTEAAAGSLN